MTITLPPALDRIVRDKVNAGLYANETELVCEALRMGLRRGHIKRNAIIHTDRGSQYASDDFRGLLKDRLTQSMSGRGNCYDNAQAESFFARFKTEIDVKIFTSVEEARSTAFDYIECYYNRIRRHTTLGTTIPAFEKQLKAGCGNVEKPKAAFPHFHSTAATNKLKEKRDFFVLKT